MIFNSSEESVDFESEQETSSGEQAYPYNNSQYYPSSVRTSSSYGAEVIGDPLAGEDYLSQYSPFADPNFIESRSPQTRNELEGEVLIRSPFVNEQDEEQEDWTSSDQQDESVADLSSEYEYGDHPESEAESFNVDQEDVQETSIDGESIFVDREDVTNEYEHGDDSMQEASDYEDLTTEDGSPFPDHDQFTTEDESEHEGIDHLFEMEYHIGEEKGKTIYLKTSGVKGKALQTGVFIPAAFKNGDRVNFILYFHGLFDHGNKANGIEMYWSTYSNVPEVLYQSNRDCILIAPGLTNDPQTAALKFLDNNGLDTYIADCFKELKDINAVSATAEPGDIILAGHSAGGYPLRNVVRKTNTLLSNLTECWGFDCFYNYGWDKISFMKPLSLLGAQ